MPASADLISALPELAKGGAWVVLAAVLIWIIKESLKRSDAQDAAHRAERKEQDTQHQAAMERLMSSHSQERTQWVAKIEAAGEKFAKSTTDQGERIGRAIEDALRRSHP